MTSRITRTARAATALAVVGAATAALAPVGAASAGTLPNASKHRQVPGGTVNIRLFDQKVSVQAPVTKMPTSREVFLSGKVKVTLTGDLQGGTVSAGYLVGCQLSVTAGSISEAGVTSDAEDQWAITVPGGPGRPATTVPTPINKGSGSTGTVSIAPGVAAFAPVVNMAVGKKAVTGFTFTEQVGGMAYSQERFGVDGCAGFAEARPVVNVQVATKEFKGNITLLGKTFSLG